MAKLAACVSVILVLLAVLGESSPTNPCCTQFQENEIPLKVLKYYRNQDTDYCNIKAVIFKTVRNKVFCANPDAKWVKTAVKSVLHKP